MGTGLSTVASYLGKEDTLAFSVAGCASRRQTQNTLRIELTLPINWICCNSVYVLPFSGEYTLAGGARLVRACPVCQSAGDCGSSQDAATPEDVGL